MTGLLKLKKRIISFSSILCKLPEKPSRALALSLGMATWQCWLSERQRLENCIDRIHFRLKRQPVAPVRDIVRMAFMHFSLVAHELLRFPLLSDKPLSERVHFSGTENLDTELSRKKGIILALPHIGNWEILGAAIARNGYPINSFFLAQKEDEVGGVLDHFRAYSGVKLHDRDRGGSKALRALKSGECLGMIADQDGAQNGIYTNFLGHWVSVPAGPANWSLKTGATLMPVYSIRRGLSPEYDAVYLPSVIESSSESHNKKVIARTKALTNWMEELILRYPHQYLWFYDRFKPRHEAWVTADKCRNGQVYHGETRYGL